MPAAGRPLHEQATALLAFLAARNNILTQPQAAYAIEGLPDEPKPAAKQLRGRLLALGVEIQHTHALKAVAEIRGAGGFLGLHEQPQWDVASWSPDTPAISCERVRTRNFADAATELCRRMRDQYDQDSPHVTIALEPSYLLLIATSAATESWWNLVLAPVGPGEEAGRFTDLPSLERLAERMRRLVEGELGGWLDGMYELEEMLEASSRQHRLVITSRHESSFPRQLGIPAEAGAPDALPAEVPAPTQWTDQRPLNQAQWDDFIKRCAAFARRQDGTSLFEWTRELVSATKQPRFEPVALNQAALEQARIVAAVTWDDLAQRVSSDDRIDAVSDLRAGRCSLDALQRVSELLGVNPDKLLAPNLEAPRIPLQQDSDLIVWLSRMKTIECLDAQEAAIPHQIVVRLKALCAAPYEARRRWDGQTPAEIESLNGDIQRAGLVVCGNLTTRFVQDLPMGWTRPASIAQFEIALQADVLIRRAQADSKRAKVDTGREEQDRVTPEWLARFNKPSFSADDLLRYGDMVRDMIGDDTSENDRFAVRAIAGVKLFKRDPNKAHAATVRMEALSRLIKTEPMEPWVRKGRSGEEEWQMVSAAAFEATARCTLVDVDGEAGFDGHSFYLLCVQHSHRYT